jgi:hypothetical protein
MNIAFQRDLENEYFVSTGTVALEARDGVDCGRGARLQAGR